MQFCKFTHPTLLNVLPSGFLGRVALPALEAIPRPREPFVLMDIHKALRQQSAEGHVDKVQLRLIPSGCSRPFKYPAGPAFGGACWLLLPYLTGNFYRREVGYQRPNCLSNLLSLVIMNHPASLIKASNLSPSLQYLVAIPRNCFKSAKKFSTLCRSF